MITSGDVEFELSGTSDQTRPVLKTLSVSRHIAMMTAGDSGVQADIVHLIAGKIAAAASTQPIRVRDFALMYTELINAARQTLITNQILAPFGLDTNSFISRQKEMDPGFIDRITTGIMRTEIEAETIFAGIDDTGAHIYKVDQNGFTCCDALGFAAIGYGARHAESQFMLANYDRHSPLVEALFLTYVAKKRSEVAPGVGEDTDMFYVSNQSGFNWIFQKRDIEPLEGIYIQFEEQQRTAFNDAKAALRRKVDEAAAKAQKAEENPPRELPPEQSK